MITLISNSTSDTKEIGNQLAHFLKKGDTIVLSGDLGAGKTMLVSGILSFYGKENDASSPTFTIVNEYTLTNDLKLFHFDVYRFNFEDEFLAMGGDEYFGRGICIIEWGEKISDYLPSDYIKISITKDSADENKRTILIDSTGKKSEELLNKLSN